MAKGDVIGKLPCAVCGHECKVKEDTNGSPYWCCGDCGARVQVGRDPDAKAAVLARITGKKPAGKPAAEGTPAAKPEKVANRDGF